MRIKKEDGLFNVYSEVYNKDDGTYGEELVEQFDNFKDAKARIDGFNRTLRNKELRDLIDNGGNYGN